MISKEFGTGPVCVDGRDSIPPPLLGVDVASMKIRRSETLARVI